MRIAVVPVVVLLAFATVACSKDDPAVRTDAGPFDREVAVSMNDALRFEPPRIAAKAGEKIKFVVTNKGRTQHEFAIGDDSFHEELDSMSGGHGGHGEVDIDGGDVVVVEPGKTAELIYTMPADAPSFVCHVDNHDEGGMKGTVVYA